MSTYVRFLGGDGRSVGGKYNVANVLVLTIVQVLSYTFKLLLLLQGEIQDSMGYDCNNKGVQVMGMQAVVVYPHSQAPLSFLLLSVLL